jgi:hypothetical protein
LEAKKRKEFFALLLPVDFVKYSAITGVLLLGLTTRFHASEKTKNSNAGWSAANKLNKPRNFVKIVVKLQPPNKHWWFFITKGENNNEKKTNLVCCGGDDSHDVGRLRPCGEDLRKGRISSGDKTREFGLGLQYLYDHCPKWG